MTMETRGLGTETLAVINALQQKSVKKYIVLMRHAERPIDTAENDLAMKLTEDGKQAAYEFGRSLPSDSLIRFFSALWTAVLRRRPSSKKGAIAAAKTWLEESDKE